MYAKQLQWYLGIISWSRTCHPGVSSSEGSPLRFPQIRSFRRDPPTGAELWRDWPCGVWGSTSRGMAPATLSGKHRDLSPAPPHPQILRQKQKNPARLQPWAPSSLSPRTALGTSLVAQWLRICLPLQGTQVRALVPWCRKIPHAAEQLSPCATTTEPAL